MSNLFITRDGASNYAAFTISQAAFEAFNAGEVGSPDMSGWVIISPLDVAKVGFTGVTAADFVRALTGDAPARFKTTALIQDRVFTALTQATDLPEFGGKPAKPAKAAKAPKEPKAAKAPKADKAPKEKKERKPRSNLNLAPKEPVRQCRSGTKQSRLIDALAKPNGATLEQLRKAVRSADEGLFGKQWTDSSIRSALSHDVNNVKGYGVRTEVRDGAPVFFLVLPASMTEPLPHK